MTSADTLEQGRDAFARREWLRAYRALAAARERGPLSAEDLELLATAAYLTGHDEERDAVMEAVHRAHIRRGDTAGAVRSAFWQGMWLLQIGETARGGGWLARAHRLAAEIDAVERGYLLIPQGVQQLTTDPAAAHAVFADAQRVAERFGDPDLAALSRLGQGQSLIRSGQARAGCMLLDEVMVAVEAGDVSPVSAGIIYCAVISFCHEIFDLHRARTWTAALQRWCDAQPDLVPFRGQCLIHRSQIMQLHGAWGDALAEAEHACRRFPDDHPAAGAAHYQRGELHRLRGELTQAEDAYRAASRLGHLPQPGLAQLRAAQGQLPAARAALRRVLDETGDGPSCATLLAAMAEIALAAGERGAAREAADELAAIAAGLGAPGVQAVSAHIAGAVLLVEGHPHEAAARLQHAATAWRELNAPYEAARARVLMGLACRELGDHDSADLELEAARGVFAGLGAALDLDRLDALTGAGRDSGGLTPREAEVLRLVAVGKSNRAIADDLVISEHTVARHVQNIFTKLGVASRTAAAAFAFEHDLV